MREQDTRNRYQKPPLDREALRDVIDLALWAGQLLLQHGAESARVEESVHRLGTALGADWIDVLVSPNVIAITTNSGEEFRTKIRRVISIGVNMRIIDEVNDISRSVIEDKMDRFDVRQRFKELDKLPRQYSQWQVVLMVGLACGSIVAARRVKRAVTLRPPGGTTRSRGFCVLPSSHCKKVHSELAVADI